jgi:hypothetical protein
MFNTDTSVQAEVSKLVVLLESQPVGTLVSYDQVNATAGEDVRATSRGVYILRNVRQKLLDRGIVYKTVRKQGVRRLPNDEVLEESGHIRELGTRRHKRALKVLRVVDYNSLNGDGKVKHDSEYALQGVLLLFGRKTSLKKIEQLTRVANLRLEIGQTLRLFTEKS